MTSKTAKLFSATPHDKIRKFAELYHRGYYVMKSNKD
jgi:hypothetical protein